MKFRYIIVLLSGEEPTGTDDRELATTIAESMDQGWIIDTETGLTLDDDPVDIEEEDASDWADQDEGSDEGSDKELD